MLKRVTDFFTGGEAGKHRRETVKKLTLRRENREAAGKNLKPGEQERLDSMTLKERRHVLKVIGVTVLGPAAFWQLSKAALEAIQRPERVPFTRLDLETPSQLTIPEIMSAQNFWRDASLQALETFSVDPRVARLKAFMEQNAVFPIPMGPKMTQLLSTVEEGQELPMDNPRAFEIVYMPPQYAENMPAPVLTEPSGRTVRVAETFEVQEWMGIVLAHELSHVWDKMEEGENSGDRQEYLAGEVKAHLFERDLLKIWGPEQFECMVREGDELAKAGDLNRFADVADQFFPIKHLDRHEQAMALASCLISTLFEVLQREGADEAALKKAYTNLESQHRRR